MRDYSGGYARTTVHQNFLLRWVRDEAVYEVWQAARRARARRRRRRRDRRTSSAARAPTRCKLGITSSMGLNARRPRAGATAMEITDPLDAQDAHQDERLPERLLPAPHREHRVLRRVDQGRRAHDPGLRRRTSPATTRAARSSTARASRSAWRPSASPTRSSAGCASTRPSALDGEDVQRLRRARRDQARSRTRCATSRCRSSSRWRR